jgi:HEAT repeat protein
MIASCTRCWTEVDSSVKICPNCDSYLTCDSRTYEEKLIGALAHPLPQARARICWLIGENKIRHAAPDLMNLAAVDPDLFVRKAAIDSLGLLREPSSASLLRAISKSENRLLAAAATKSLHAVTQQLTRPVT